MVIGFILLITVWSLPYTGSGKANHNFCRIAFNTAYFFIPLTTGLKYKVRQVQVQETFVTGGVSCPDAKDLLSISVCNVRKKIKREKRDKKAEGTGLNIFFSLC